MWALFSPLYEMILRFLNHVLILLPSSHLLHIFTVNKIPGGPRTQVFVVTIASLALCAVPVYWKNEKQGHDLFSQEKPEAVKANEEKLQKEYRKQKNQQQ